MPDEVLRGRLTGLSGELADYFINQLAIQRELKGQTCPGEEICATSGPLLRYRGTPIEQVCGGCNLRHTKENNGPQNLAYAINTALDLDEVKQAGAVFSYPESLSAYEWACVRGLQRARAKDEQAQQAKQREKENNQVAQNRLRSMR